MPALARPETRYARNGDIHLAYQLFGEGELAIVVVGGWISNLDVLWDHPKVAENWERMASLARVVMFDRRGIGLSDPVDRAPTLEERMDDLKAVMDDAGLDQVVLYGNSEGGPLCILFAATYPERVSSLVLYGTMARTTRTADYPYGNDVDALFEAGRELLTPYWGTGATVEFVSPSVADDPDVRAFFARLERHGSSPDMLRQSFLAFIDTDVTDILDAVRVPTLVMHRTHDRLVDVRAGRWLAERIPGAKYVELPGDDHNYWFDGGGELIAGEIEEFLLGHRREREPDRALMTVMFCLVDPPEKAADQLPAMRAALAANRGREIKDLGDGLLATFDGPARAIRCAQAIVAASDRAGLAVRAGIHTGEVELLGDDIGGIAVHVGQRVAALAAPGEVLTSSTVKDLVAGSQVEFADRGEHELKGLPGRRQVYAALS